MIKCNICKREFPNKGSLSNHFRWHDLPQYKEFQEKQRKVSKESIYQKMIKGRRSYKNENNPNWKGDKVGYGALHCWIRKNKIKPELCEICGKKRKLELSNVSEEYKRDINDYKYLCVECHKKYDGNWENFVQAGIPTRFKKGG